MDSIRRPAVTILGENAIIPDRNLISPAPNQFTHELLRAQPFYFAKVQPGAAPAGEFPAGAHVVLLVYTGGDTCRVADTQGLYVEIEYSSLRKL